jgi:plasmid stabilization system protein ParE
VAYRLIWISTAHLDLQTFAEYINEHNPAAAKKYIRELIQAVNRLKVFPESGRIVPEFQDSAIREIIHPPCRIVYRLKDEQSLIEILRVWHAKRGQPEIWPPKLTN